MIVGARNSVPSVPPMIPDPGSGGGAGKISWFMLLFFAFGGLGDAFVTTTFLVVVVVLVVFVVIGGEATSGCRKDIGAALAL